MELMNSMFLMGSPARQAMATRRRWRCRDYRRDRPSRRRRSPAHHRRVGGIAFARRSNTYAPRTGWAPAGPNYRGHRSITMQCSRMVTRGSARRSSRIDSIAWPVMSPMQNWELGCPPRGPDRSRRPVRRGQPQLLQFGDAPGPPLTSVHHRLIAQSACGQGAANMQSCPRSHDAGDAAPGIVGVARRNPFGDDQHPSMLTQMQADIKPGNAAAQNR